MGARGGVSSFAFGGILCFFERGAGVSGGLGTGSKYFRVLPVQVSALRWHVSLLWLLGQLRIVFFQDDRSIYLLNYAMFGY